MELVRVRVREREVEEGDGEEVKSEVVVDVAVMVPYSLRCAVEGWFVMVWMLGSEARRETAGRGGDSGW